MSQQQPDRWGRTRADYERGLPDYHDPTGGFGGAAPTYSPLTFRAVLAAFGVLCAIAGVVVFLTVVVLPWAAIAFGVIGLISLVDLVWVLYRKARGEPG